jgi:hypothetical protein
MLSTILRSMLRLSIISCFAIGLSFGEDTLNDVIKRTDMTNADSVYELAEWCAANNKPSTAHKYYVMVVSIDKDHEAARNRLGQVKVNGHWVALSQLPARPPSANPASTDGQGDDGLLGGGTAPGPSAKDVKWDLTLPPVSVESPFVDGQIERMNRVKSDSEDMDSAVLTLLRPDTRPPLLRHLAAALLRPDYNAIYGASQIMKGLWDQGKHAAARTLLPFVVVCSAHVTDADSLSALCYIGPILRDRRIIPRMIELLGDSSTDVKENATQAIATITLLPAKEVTPARAKAWWNRNWNVPEKQVYAEQLRSSDMAIAISAADALYDLRDLDLVPVMIKALKSDNASVDNQAVSLLTKITGTDWGYTNDMKPQEKAKIAASVEKWWKENANKFKWIEDRESASNPAGPAKPVDPLADLIHQLASVEGNQSESAQANLLGKGKVAVPILITGLSDPDSLIRSKCNDLLKDISKQDFQFSAHADDAQSAKAIAAWRDWAKSQKIALPADPDDAPENPGK